MTRLPRVGILGGTLDPVHAGHLETASAARRALDLDRVILVPSRIPPHRQPQPAASRYHRFAMAALAVNGVDWMEASDLELQAPGPSYTVHTLSRLHASGLLPVQLFFITGADAFAEIETWHRYPAILDQSHFVAVSRTGYPAGRLKATLPALATRMRPGTLEHASASNPAIFLVDAKTPDISSSEIRRRLRTGEPVRGLVPLAVETHIRQHRLYVPAAAATVRSPADHLHGED